MLSKELNERCLAVVDRPRLTMASVRRLLRGDEVYETDFVLSMAPLAAFNQTRFIVVRHGQTIAVHALLYLYNKNPAKGDDPHAGPEYCGNIAVTIGPWGDGEGSMTITFAENSLPSFRTALLRDEWKATAWKVIRPLRWSFEHAHNNRGCIFESEEVLFSAYFREGDLFRLSPVVDFNLSRVDCDSIEVSSWNFSAGLGKLLQNDSVGCPSRRVPRVAPVGQRLLSVTNDILMVMRNRPYSPQALNTEMAALRSWGVERVHWIDNEGYPAPPGSNYAASLRLCGNLLGTACSAAHANGLEFVADMKLYDLSFLTERREGKPLRGQPVFDGAECLAFEPEMNSRDDLFAESNPVWRRQARFPITVVRLFSLEPVTDFNSADIELSQSADNLSYSAVSMRSVKVRVAKVRRPNIRWTVDGRAPDKGTTLCWMIELQGLRITQPFLSIRFGSAAPTLVNRQFALLEAESADGWQAPFIIGRAIGGLMPFEKKGGGACRRYTFSADGMLSAGDEPVVSFRRWPLADLGVALVEPDSIPGMLEPTHPEARAIWLKRIDRFLDANVDGVGIRPLRHHRGCHSWTRYAYAPSALAAFRQAHGRDPAPDLADVQRMRAVRGKGFDHFMEDASAKIKARGKKVIFQLELTGGDLAAVDSRMGFDFNLKDWISRGLIDEIHVRAISGHHPWLRKVLLPHASRHRVGVHLLTPNAASGYRHVDLMQLDLLARQSIEMGYSGVNVYETANLYEHTIAGTIQSRALGQTCVEQAGRVLRGDS